VTSSNIGVLVGTRTALFAGGIAALLDSEPDMRCLETATSGQSLLELLRHFAPDVVIVDVMLPDVDAPTLFRRIR
jgi:DNA-binding NarL/FixJ family response regulator